MKEQTLIGLNKKESEKLSSALNKLLASYQVHYQNLRGIHWNIKGKQFFQLHVKFEELYNDAQLRIDLIAERILTLGFRPLHSFSDYLSATKIKESKFIQSDVESVDMVLDNLLILIQQERVAFELASKLNDKSTEDLLTQLIVFHEKTIWMLSAWKGA